MALLSVEDLVVRFRTHEGTIHAVNGVTFELEEGERLGLVGESGCGKSVTNLAIIRLLPKPAGRIEGGRVLFDGQDLTVLPEAEVRDIRGSDIAMIFQDPMTSLNPVLTIREQMVETIQAHRKVTKAEAEKRAVELLAMVGIPKAADRLKDYPHQFSGGMRQRVMIAIALALEPKLLIADEPTTALDVTIQAQVLDLLRNLTTEQGTALVLITHDLGVVAGMTQRINVMYAGFIVETATTADLFAHPSHPYTIGLLHSVPRLDAVEGEELIPIEGRPPDMRRAPTGCPFAPRCAWRLEACWADNPGLRALSGEETVVTTGERATHRSACHNPPTAEEAAAGRPLRAGFTAAPPPSGAIDELGGTTANIDDFGGLVAAIEAEESPIEPFPSAAGLPLPPEPERRNDGI
ncbi:MAG: ABC transporter ATP-binding protein [Chloroflexi bacterium]|jgi:oligopeptide/dipeptide ABC transporter ATP-binding protein|nr:ABC transporter ATP-binding protein [Chloroflexota bacterium]